MPRLCWPLSGNGNYLTGPVRRANGGPVDREASGPLAIPPLQPETSGWKSSRAFLHDQLHGVRQHLSKRLHELGVEAAHARSAHSSSVAEVPLGDRQLQQAAVQFPVRTEVP